MDYEQFSQIWKNPLFSENEKKYLLDTVCLKKALELDLLS